MAAGSNGAMTLIFRVKKEFLKMKTAQSLSKTICKKWGKMNLI